MIKFNYTLFDGNGNSFAVGSFEAEDSQPVIKAKATEILNQDTAAATISIYNQKYEWVGDVKKDPNQFRCKKCNTPLRTGAERWNGICIPCSVKQHIRKELAGPWL